MARPRTVFACTRCGAQQPRWLGRCPECGGWDTLVEEGRAAETGAGRDLLADVSVGGAGRDLLADASGGSAGRVSVGASGGSAGWASVGASVAGASAKARTLREIEASGAPRIETGVAELDRVLGGGLVPGSVTLLAGEPGIGKSTLALQIAAGARVAAPILYVTGEESAEQVRLRAERLESFPADLLVLTETHVEALAEPWRMHAPALVLVDSVQALHSDRVESAPGSVAQVRESAGLLAAAAKSSGAALLIVGHVTKDGAIAGPRVLEHLVDVVLTFEGDRGHAFRLLRASKNRFGSTKEVGVFQMTERGLECVENPSELFLAERRSGAPGSCIVPLVEGTRPMLVEIQALVAPAGYATARRTSLGVDDGRLALLLAVLDSRSDVDVLSRDVYVNVVGGVRVTEPGADLGLALALVSSRLDLALPDDTAACGEIGLGGELRRVGRSDARLREAARLGFRRVLLPAAAAATAPVPSGLEVVALGEVADAVAWLRERSGPATRTP